MLIPLIKSKWEDVRNTARSFGSPAPAATATPRDVLKGAAPVKDWTVLVYMEGRHRLAPSTLLGLNKLEQVGSTDNLNVVVQATMAPTFKDRAFPGMKDLPTQRYFITQDNDPRKVSSPVVGKFASQLPLNSDNMADFLTWGVKNFPAKHYLVIVKKHGAGFAKIGNEKEYTAPLSARDMEAALDKTKKATGQDLDVLAWDSCAMQQVEVGFQLRKHVGVMVGSPEDIPAKDYPYGSIVGALAQVASKATAEDVGKIIVEAHRQKLPNSVETAVKLSSMEPMAQSMGRLVETIQAEKVSRDLIYTAMIDSPSVEPDQTMALQFNFRDLGGFAARLAMDERVPRSVRQRASQFAHTLADSRIDHHVGQGKKILKNPTGYSTFAPWKALNGDLKKSYLELDYPKESRWGELLDYVFDGPAPAQSAPPADLESLGVQPGRRGHPGLGQKFGKWALWNYKKFVSPFLGVVCPYDPSCSQYAREAVEKYGLMQGSKLAIFRVLSCTGHNEGHDPVPEKLIDGHPTAHHCDDHCHHDSSAPVVRMPETLISPPEKIEKSSTRRRLEGTAITAARLTGRYAGGAAAATMGLLPGLAAGAFLGYKAGAGTMDDFTASLLAKNCNHAGAESIVKVAQGVGLPGAAVHNFTEAKTGSSKLAKWVGGTTGALTGALLGALGGAVEAYSWGAKFGRLWCENRTKDAFGEFPKQPSNQEILQRDYAKS